MSCVGCRCFALNRVEWDVNAVNEKVMQGIRKNGGNGIEKGVVCRMKTIKADPSWEKSYKGDKDRKRMRGTINR